MTPEISVIAPVYNVEKYLRECIDSMIAQTFTNWEFLLIDDGSPDNSGAICDEYAAKDPRIRVIHKPNEGVSRARNTGLRAATGRYIMFLDSDDWIEKDMLHDLYTHAVEADADCATSGIWYFYEDGRANQVYLPPEGSFDAQHDFNEWFTAFDENFIFCSQWNKLYRKSLLEEHNIFQEERFCILEDCTFIMDVITHCRKIVCLNKAYYHYRHTANFSLMKKYNANSADALAQYWNKSQIFLERLNATNRTTMSHNFQRYYFQFLLQIYTRSSLTQSDAYNDLKKFDVKRFPFLKERVKRGKKYSFILFLMRIRALRAVHWLLWAKYAHK